MDKYIIVNKSDNSILCKDKYSSRRYRQARGNIDEHLVILRTTKGRAEQEMNYLNKNYNKGWEIQKVEPIVFYDNAEDREKYLTEYETLNKEEIEKIKKETAEKILNDVYYEFTKTSTWKDVRTWWLLNGECEQLKNLLNKIAKQYGIEAKND